MPHPKKPKVTKAPLRGEEDAETLAAIDEGLRDVKAGRVVPAEEVRKLVHEWTSASSIQKKRWRIWNRFWMKSLLTMQKQLRALEVPSLTTSIY